MADIKISQLPEAEPLAGDELMPVVQDTGDGTLETRKATASSLGGLFVKLVSATTQVIDSDVAMAVGRKFLGTAADGTQHELAGLNEYEGGQQVEVGTGAVPLCLNHREVPDWSDKHIAVNWQNIYGDESVDNLAYLSDLPAKASNAEAQAGTESTKYLVSNVLASWWTWIKTQSLTLTSALTVGGNATLNGTNNTAPNQVGATPNEGTLLTLDQARTQAMFSELFAYRFSQSEEAVIVCNPANTITADKYDNISELLLANNGTVGDHASLHILNDVQGNWFGDIHYPWNYKGVLLFNLGGSNLSGDLSVVAGVGLFNPDINPGTDQWNVDAPFLASGTKFVWVVLARFSSGVIQLRLIAKDNVADSPPYDSGWINTVSTSASATNSFSWIGVQFSGVIANQVRLQLFYCPTREYQLTGRPVFTSLAITPMLATGDSRESFSLTVQRTGTSLSRILLNKPVFYRDVQLLNWN